MVKEWTRGLERESTYLGGLRTEECGIKDKWDWGNFGNGLMAVLITYQVVYVGIIYGTYPIIH